MRPQEDPPCELFSHQTAHGSICHKFLTLIRKMKLKLCYWLCGSDIFYPCQSVFSSFCVSWSRISFSRSSLCRVWCSASTSLRRLSWHHYQQTYPSSHGAKAFELQLITQALICSKWGEHVTETVVNKSSQLLLLIITVITLIIFNSAPWYEPVSVYSHLWMPRSQVLMPTFKLTLVHLIMSYAQESAWLLAKKKWTPLERGMNNLFGSYSPWHMYLAVLLFSPSLSLCHCAPPSEPALLKTDGAPKKQRRVIDTCRN